MHNELIIFENQNVKLEVNMRDETVWLSLEQMSKLFERDRSVITRHINNVFKEHELEKDVVCAKFAHTTIHGALSNKTQTRELDYYNLDMIISVGYRVKSKNGVIFRKWANKVLKEYLLKGYAVNKKRLEYLEKTVKLIDIAGRIDTNLKGDEAQGIIKVINNYSNALNLLDDYDHKRVVKPNGSKSNEKIKYEDCIDIINKLKFKNDSELFGRERDKGLDSIINNIYASFLAVDVYPTVEEKAANNLSKIAKVDINKFAKGMFEAAVSIKGKTIEELIYNDFKSFNISNRKIGIGQMTVIDYEKVLRDKDKYVLTLEKISREHDYDIMAFCITDVINNNTYLLYNTKAKTVFETIFNISSIYEGYKLEGVVSRKKQIIPLLMEELK